MSRSPSLRRGATPARLPVVLAGVALFLTLQFARAIHALVKQGDGMANRFSDLAREKYLSFLIGQNVQLLLAYALLALCGALLLQPLVDWLSRRSRHRGWRSVMLRAFVLSAALHGFFVLRLVETRPYFLRPVDFGHWYYRIFEIVPDAARPATFTILFTILPVLAATAALLWHLHRWLGPRLWIPAGSACALAGIGWIAIPGTSPAEPRAGNPDTRRPPNFLIIGSDSLRGDLLGVAGHRPARRDGLAAAGVSPLIDSLAARSTRFELCYTPIASTLESGISLMASQYPHSHGVRHMYPDRETLDETLRRVRPLPEIMREAGYDTAAIGDWCAGYYDLVPLGFESVSVSSFDNFKIYMSQAVILSHFVVPLYFDHPLGYLLFPQLGSFAQFVTPEVVTQRVERRLERVAANGKPFFWHVFYSCNHLPFRSPEPYRSMFTDPDYRGPNRNGVDFDIDAFIGGTDLEDKWNALPPHEIEQIRALYDGCTRQFDDCVGRILAALDRHGLAEDTIVIITSDHGDDLYEPGVTLGHGLTFNGGLRANHVPLIFHLPGRQPRVIPEAVRTIDLAPTLAELAGLEIPKRWEGRSFASWLDQSEPPEWRPFYGETGFPFIQFRVPGIERPSLPPMDRMTYIDESFNYQFVLDPAYHEPLVSAKQRCLRTRYWKLVCTPTAEGTRHYQLYHLESDPDAENDLAASRADLLEPLRVALDRWIDERVETSISDIFPAGEPAS